MIIMRGVSGSGKSTWVRQHYPEAVVVSADDFFVLPSGERKFDPEKKGEAHQSCWRRFHEALTAKKLLIVVDNNNITAWEIAPYVLPAQALGYEVQILTLLVDPETAIKRKDWVPPSVTRAKASMLEHEARHFPPSFKAIHRVVSNE